MMTWTKAKLATAAVIGAVAIGGAGRLLTLPRALADEQPVARAAGGAARAPGEKKKNGVSVETTPPVVVTTVPQAGATDVDASAVKEIRVTFSKDMADGSWSWSTLGEDTFPETTGKPRYLEDKRTCVLPVKLQPGRAYAIWLNSEQFGNFKDSGGQKAVPYLLVFETKE